MGCVREPKPGLLSDVLGLDNLVQGRRPRILRRVDHIHATGQQRRKNQEAPARGGIAMAGAAGVPAGVMQLVADVGGREPVDHLGVRR